MNISRIYSAKGEVGFTTTSYQIEYHRRENLSPVRVNIPRIDSAKGTKAGFTTTGFWVADRKKKETRHRLG